MSIATPTKDSIREELQAYLASRLPGVAAGSDTDIGVRIAMLAEALFGLYSQIKAVEEDLFVSDRTSTEGLDKHAEARLEGGRKGATTSSGTDALQVTGTVATGLAAGLELVAADGSRFVTSEAETIGAGGTVDVSIVSTSTGTVTNRAIGETLTFVEPPSGIQATAELIAETTGAVDIETDGALVRRLLDVYQNPLAGGRFSDWRQWATLQAGVSTAYTYGPSSDALLGRRGLGIVDVAILGAGTGADRIPSATVQETVEDYIETVRPAMTRDFGVILPTATTEDIDVTIEPIPGYEFDWVRATPTGETVLVWTPATKTIRVGPITTTIAVGDRIWARGVLATVLSRVDGGGNVDIVIDVDIPGLIATDGIHPGGPLSEPAEAAIKTIFSDLGPAKGTAPDPNQDWDDTLRVASIYDALMDVEGVRDVALTTPATNQTPTDTPGGTTELITLGTLTIQVAV